MRIVNFVVDCFVVSGVVWPYYPQVRVRTRHAAS
jgi:hypothetical protein